MSWISMQFTQLTEHTQTNQNVSAKHIDSAKGQVPETQENINPTQEAPFINKKEWQGAAVRKEAIKREQIIPADLRSSTI